MNFNRFFNGERNSRPQPWPLLKSTSLLYADFRFKRPLMFRAEYEFAYRLMVKRLFLLETSVHRMPLDSCFRNQTHRIVEWYRNSISSSYANVYLYTAMCFCQSLEYLRGTGTDISHLDHVASKWNFTCRSENCNQSSARKYPKPILALAIKSTQTTFLEFYRREIAMGILESATQFSSDDAVSCQASCIQNSLFLFRLSQNKSRCSRRTWRTNEQQKKEAKTFFNCWCIKKRERKQSNLWSKNSIQLVT